MELGLAKKRPTRAIPEGCCSIGGILISVECKQVVLYNVFFQHDCHCTAGGIYFIYLEQRYLTCNIHSSKEVMREEADAMKRIAVAQVRNTPESGVYLNVWFQYNGTLLEVIASNNEAVTCYLS